MDIENVLKLKSVLDTEIRSLIVNFEHVTKLTVSTVRIHRTDEQYVYDKKGQRWVVDVFTEVKL